MRRYIGTDILSKIIWDKWQECDELKYVIPEIRNVIMGASFEQVDTVKHGKWEIYGEYRETIDGRTFDGWCECSICKQMFSMDMSAWNWKYCPYCGARMDNED